MTQEEVNLIYEYLREHYEYVDGELIAKKQTKGKRIGEKLGHFNTSSDYPAMKASININNKNYTSPLSSFIYLYFKKTWEPNLELIDGNVTNTRIDNLKIKIRTCSASLKRINKGFLKENRNGRVVYRCLVSLGGKKISLGYYDSIEECKQINKFAKDILSKELCTPEGVKEKVLSAHPNAKIRIKQKCMPGVYVRGNKFRAAIYRNGHKINIGTYLTEEEAHAAYLKAKEEMK